VKNITITEVNEMLETARNYFKEKLLRGEFEIIEQNFHTILLKVDGHEFRIWVCVNNSEKTRKQYSNSNIGEVEPLDLRITDEESILIDATLKPIIEKYIQEVEIKELEERLNQLKK